MYLKSFEIYIYIYVNRKLKTKRNFSFSDDEKKISKENSKSEEIKLIRRRDSTKLEFLRDKTYGKSQKENEKC